MSNNYSSSLNGGVIIRSPNYDLLYKYFINNIDVYDFNGAIPQKSKSKCFNLFLNENYEVNNYQSNTQNYQICKAFRKDYNPSNSNTNKECRKETVDKTSLSYRQWYFIAGYGNAHDTRSIWFRPILEFRNNI